MSHAPALPPIFDLPTPPEDAAIVLVPVPFDATATYGRAAMDGPTTIRRESVQVDLYDALLGSELDPVVTMQEENERVRAWCLEARRLVDRVRAEPHAKGNETLVAEIDGIGSRLGRWVYEQCASILSRDRVAAIIGGDHSTAFGCIQAHLERYPHMGLLHIDAHADLRLSYGGFAWSHASIMRNVLEKTELTRLVQVGIRDYCREEHDVITGSGGRVVTFFDVETSRERLGGASFASQVARIVGALPEEVYVSFDIDGLDPTLCPHTGTPVPGGLSYAEATYLLEALVHAGHRIVGFDLTEVAPGIPDTLWDGNVGARILFKLVTSVLASGADA